MVSRISRSGSGARSLEGSTADRLTTSWRNSRSSSVIGQSKALARRHATFDPLERRIGVVSLEHPAGPLSCEPFGKPGLDSARGGLLLPSRRHREIVGVFVLGVAAMATNPGPLYVVQPAASASSCHNGRFSM